MKPMSTLFKTILFLLILSVPLLSQTTAVTATVQDSNGQLWNNGTFQIQFVPTPGMPGPWYYNGAILTPSQTLLQGSLTGSGGFSATIISTSSITPAGSSWAFTFCPNATSPCGTLTTPINGTTLNISAAVTSVIPPVNVNAPLVPRAYSDAEVSAPPPNQGGLYFNVTYTQPKYWTGATWNFFAGGGTLTSVGLAAPVEFTVTGSPVTGAGGTLTFGWAGPVQIIHGGTNATTPAAAMTNLLPTYVAGDYLTTIDGINLSWGNPTANLYYQTVASNGSTEPQQPTLNFSPRFAVSDGSSETTVDYTVSGVTAGTYAYPTSVTVDTYGRVTSLTAGTATARTCGSYGCWSTRPDGTIDEWIVTGALNNNTPTVVTLPHAYPTALMSVTCSDNSSRVTSGNDQPVGAIASGSGGQSTITVNTPATGMSAYCYLAAY